MHGKMKFKEFIKLEDIFKDYLNYNGIHLWKLSEVGMYENFIKFRKKRGLIDEKKDLLLRKFIELNNNKKEKEYTEKIGLKKDILMILYGISPINTFKPIINKLGNKIKVIRYDPPSENTTKIFLEKNKINYSNIDNYIDDSIKKELKEAERWLSLEWKRIRKDTEIKKKLGKDYDLIIKALKYFCYTRKSYLEIIRLIELYTRTYEIEKPKEIIVSDDSNAYGRTAIEVAKKNKIFTLCIQHGQLQGNIVVSDGADKLIVNGFQDKRYLISQGVKKNKIIVTGQIRFDNIHKELKITREKACIKLGINPKKKVVLFTFQKKVAGENVTQSAIKCFISELKKIKNKEDYEFIISAREDIPLKMLPKSTGNLKFKIIRGGEIHNLLRAVDVFSTAFSTVAIEAILLEKPVISINIDSKENEYINYTKLGVGFKITKEEDFLRALNNCLENKEFLKKFKISREKFIKDYNYKLDGRALERIINEINKILK